MGREAETANFDFRKLRRLRKWLRFAGEGDGDGANCVNIVERLSETKIKIKI